MSTPAPPWVNPRTIKTLNVGSTPTIIGSSFYKMAVDCINFINLGQNPTKVFSYILDEDGQQNTGKQVSIPAFGNIDILEYSMLTLEPGELLYAYSDFSSNQFNAFVTGREFIEIGAPSDVRSRRKS